MFGIGPMELMAILVVALLVFGPKRIPELARTMGRGLAEFRRASNDLRQSLALDELQRDLRQDLSEKQTIHRPGDRPAQAGDGVESEQLAKTAKTETSEQTETQADAPSPAERHPGELPLGEAHDHEHHDDPTKQDAPETADTSLGSVPVGGSKTSDPPRG